jgi:co-chaperonin GroES (HSP10)
MALQPLRNYAAVEPLKQQDEVVNGIFISANQLGEGVLKGTVVAAGPDTLLKVGDIIAYGRYGWGEMRDNGRVIHIMPDELVLSVIVPDVVVAE